MGTHKLSDLFSIEAVAMGVAFCVASHFLLGATGIDAWVHDTSAKLGESLGFIDPSAGGHTHGHGHAHAGHSHGDIYNQIATSEPAFEFE